MYTHMNNKMFKSHQTLIAETNYLVVTTDILK